MPEIDRADPVLRLHRGGLGHHGDLQREQPVSGRRSAHAGLLEELEHLHGGNQAQTAAHLGGPEEGVYLLDDLLPQTIAR